MTQKSKLVETMRNEAAFMDNAGKQAIDRAIAIVTAYQSTQQDTLREAIADIQEIRDTTPIVIQRQKLDNALRLLNDMMGE